VPDYAQILRKKIEEADKKDPGKSHLFISTLGDDLQTMQELEGWQPKKETGQGTAGEVRVGDLILCERPRERSEEERKAQRERSAGQFKAIENEFKRQINTAGGHGKFLAPLAPGESRTFGRRED
jgi:hypothetical protein